MEASSRFKDLHYNFALIYVTAVQDDVEYFDSFWVLDYTT